MKIAYLILAHQHPEQLLRLVQRLKSGETSFLIHIDRKSDPAVNQKARELLNPIDRVYFLPRFVCHWGEFGIVKATMSGIQKAIEFGIDFDYLVFLSALDYPIESNEKIAASLKILNGKSILDFHPLPREIWRKQNGGFDRIDRWYFRMSNELHCYPAWGPLANRRLTFLFWMLQFFLPAKRSLPAPYRAYGGSAYFCFSAPCVRYLYDEFKRNSPIVRFFKHANVPDELFYQTILVNSPLKETLQNGALHFMRWEENSSHPAILRKEDFDAIAGSSKLFARKFDVSKDAEILDLIDRQLLHRHHAV